MALKNTVSVDYEKLRFSLLLLRTQDLTLLNPHSLGAQMASAHLACIEKNIRNGLYWNL